MDTGRHVPVLLNDAVEALAIRPEHILVDATYGRGGHSTALLAQLGGQGRLFALDRDPDALADAAIRFADEIRFEIRQANFADLAEVAEQWHIAGRVDGLLLDIGVSSPQLDTAERGFGIVRDGQLDMRMDTRSGETAADWLARVSETDLAQVLKTYGEERHARRIAAAIVAARSEAPIRRTGQLAEIVKLAHPAWPKHHHPATRTFQAIRIQINGELDALRSVLEQAQRVLRIGGRLAVISFHSLEDRIVKHALRAPQPPADWPRHLPLPPMAGPVWRSIGKAVRAADAETDDNPRARSAVLRVAERIA